MGEALCYTDPSCRGPLTASGSAPTQTSDLSFESCTSTASPGPFPVPAPGVLTVRVQTATSLVPHISLVSPTTHKVDVKYGFFALAPRRRVHQRGSAIYNFGKDRDGVGVGQVTGSPGALWELWAGGFSQPRGRDSLARAALLSPVVFIIFHSQTILEAGCHGN